ncbi:MAG: TIGR00159 family protein [Bacteroidaceae bacterium]|nr:TIGR00159 family protein [Bacteroidaceae bacterium]
MFFNFGIIDALDILLVAAILYYCYRVMRDSRSLSVFFGVMAFVVAWFVISQILEMRMLGAILDKLVSVGVLALLILFQDDIRRFFYRIGSGKGAKHWLAFLRGKRRAPVKSDLTAIVRACASMSRGKVGALIVIERADTLNDLIKTGDTVNADVSQRLIENIFFKNSPLHDGAMIVQNRRIMAAGCILPVSHDLAIPKELGLRHRAAKGITEETDALCIVVSEETGAISVAQHGEFRLNLKTEELDEIINALNEHE